MAYSCFLSRPILALPFLARVVPSKAVFTFGHESFITLAVFAVLTVPAVHNVLAVRTVHAVLTVSGALTVHALLTVYALLTVSAALTDHIDIVMYDIHNDI